MHPNVPAGLYRYIGPHGFVRVVDTMGDDRAIVRAARVTAQTTKQISSDRGLLRYLLRHHHGTPFEMCEICLHVRVPMDIWRQWIRHRTASVNEVSSRYGALTPEFASTDPEEWRTAAGRLRPGGTPGLFKQDAGKIFSIAERELWDNAEDAYRELLAAGVAPEMARKVLPLGTYTEAYWKIDLRNLLHFLELRLAPGAQAEIREYAEAIAKIVQEWVPLTWEAFKDYRLDAVTLTGPELRALRAGDWVCLSPGECKELDDKLEKINATQEILRTPTDS
jgi:thymidylate synthase (FAD)